MSGSILQHYPFIGFIIKNNKQLCFYFFWTPLCLCCLLVYFKQRSFNFQCNECQFKWMHVRVCGLAPEAVSTQLPLSKADRKQLSLTCPQYGEQRPSPGTSCHNTHQFQTNAYWTRPTLSTFSCVYDKVTLHLED